MQKHNFLQRYSARFCFSSRLEVQVRVTTFSGRARVITHSSFFSCKMDLENPKTMSMMNKMMQDKNTKKAMEDPSVIEIMKENMEKLSVNMSIGTLTGTLKNETLIRQHNKNRTSLFQDMVGFKTTFDTNPSIDMIKHKTKKSKKVMWTSALPISIEKLILDTTHHSRILTGTLIVDPTVLTSVQTLIQDDYGDVLNISFYSNAVKSCNSFMEKWNMAHALFPKGSRVAVLEPYYKIAMDMSRMIRVDDMDDVQFLEHQPTKNTSLSLKQQGNALYSAHHFEDSNKAYLLAIELHPRVVLYTTLCQNLSLVHLKLNQPCTAVQYGLAAILCGSVSDKVHFRMAKALDVLGYVDLALSCCTRIAKGCQDTEYKRLYFDLKKKCKTKQHDEVDDNPMQIWEHMDMMQLLSNDPPALNQLTNQDLEDACQLKQIGNDCVKKNAFKEACIFYEKALLVLEADTNEVPLATLLANISSGSIQLGHFKKAMMESTLAVLLQPTYAKAHYRRILSLINIGLPVNGKVAFEYGCRVLGPEKASVIESLKPRLAVTPVVKKDSVGLEEKWNTSSNTASTDAVAMLNMMADLYGDKAKAMGVENRPVAAFHRMYAEENSWPKQVNVEEGQKVLKTAYELARSGGTRMELLTIENDQKSFLKRVHTMDRDDWERFERLQMGQVYVRKRTPFGFGKIHHNFGNVAQISQNFKDGKTHVSVGFADLQELCIGCFSEDGGLPVRWVGYDQSPFVIAKTMVLIEMLQGSINCDPISVIQVWYSAAWSHKTLTDFRTALTTVLNCFVPSCKEEGDVLEFFHCWQQHTITLKMARTGWLETHSDRPWSSDIANWKLKSDQLAMCTYVLTGQLFKATVGSVVMYALPSGESVIAPNDNVLHIICIFDLLKQRDTKNCLNCIDAVTDLLTERVEKLTKRIRSGLLLPSVKLGSVSRKNVALLKEIHSLSPWHMSWSNLCDYLTPTDFHYIARKCSATSDTMHFGYSMNWTTETMGASILDFQINMRKEILENSEEGIKQMLEGYPSYKTYMTLPPNTNPINVADFALATMHYNAWFDSFMKADVFGPHQGVCEKTEYSVLYSLSNNITFNFTYDPDICMQQKIE